MDPHASATHARVTCADIGASYARFTQNRDLPQAVALAGTTELAAMGHLLFNIERKGLFLGQRDAKAVLAQLSEPTGPLENRHQLLRTLRSLGLVDTKLPDRDLIPAGTLPGARTVMHVVEIEYGRQTHEIASPSRQRDIARIRFQAIWLMRQICGHSLNVIGDHFGGRDHTTILNAINKIDTERGNNPALAEKLEVLCEQIDNLTVAQCYGRLEAAARQAAG